VAAALIASVSVAITAQNAVDDLIAKNIAAKGGLEKLKSIQSMKQISTMTTQGVEATITVYSKRPNLQRQEVRIAGQTVTNGFDGEVSWILNPLSGMNRAIVVTGAQADVIREQAAFDGPLVDYQARGSKVLLSGGIETWQIATARASAACEVSGSASSESSILTIRETCPLSARP